MSTGKVGKRLVDVRPDRVDLRDRPYRPPLISLPAAWPDLDLAVKKLLPEYVKHGMILNQGDEGACTGFGLAAVVNYLLWSAENLDEYGDLVKGGTKVARVSERMLYHLARIYDEWPGEDYDGSSCRGAIKGWHRHGVCSASLWPYRAKAPKGKKLGAVRFIKPKKGWERDAATRPLGAYYRIDKDSVADMQAAIYEVGAIYCSAQVHGGWDSPAGDGLPIIEQQDADGGHAFAIVGFTEDGFIVQNSWDTGWGRSGFAVLRYSDWVQNGMDAWVAVMGAPVTTTRTLSTFSTATQRQAADGRATWFWSSESNEKGYPYKNAEVQPWSETDAYYHSVVLGNDGRALNRIVSAENAAEAIETVAYTGPRDWLAAAPTPRLVIYAHGGLNDEGDAIKRVRTMAPYFKANGIYPLFLTWRTGFLESITGIISDSVKRLFWGDRAEGWLGDQLDKIKNRLAEAKDRSVEVACEKLLVKAVWSQMRQNAGAALRHEAGGVQVAQYLAQLSKDFPKLEIHFAGHSAGSIILGHLITELTRRRTAVRSVHLWAPACTTGFALEHYGGAVKAGTLAKKRLHITILNDARERADTVGPYGKSLLYLVSRALEDVHKMPLLGLENAWGDGQLGYWNKPVRKDIEDWTAFAGTLRPRVLIDEKVNDGQGLIDSAHGAFDNDVEVVGRAIKEMLGAKPKFPVESLRGF